MNPETNSMRAGSWLPLFKQHRVNVWCYPGNHFHNFEQSHRYGWRLAIFLQPLYQRWQWHAEVSGKFRTGQTVAGFQGRECVIGLHLIGRSLGEPFLGWFGSEGGAAGKRVADVAVAGHRIDIIAPRHAGIAWVGILPFGAPVLVAQRGVIEPELPP